MISTDEILADLERLVYQSVVAQYGESVALACCRALVNCLYLNFRRVRMYVPNTNYTALNALYESIWHEFNGRNHKDLALKYHRTVQQIYTIVAAMRKRAVRGVQVDVFPLPDEVDKKPLTLQVFAEYVPAELMRAGLPAAHAHMLAEQLADYLCANYPGLSIIITSAHWERRRIDPNHDLFA